MDDNRKQALTAALSQIDRAFGKGSVMKLGQKQSMDVEAISTGSFGLDIALGIGGLPSGRIIEVYGPESSGKTTLALHVIAEAQKNGHVAAFVDAEHALDPIYAGKLGVDVNELLISQPDTGEQALEIADTLVRSGAVGILVVDSVAALTPRAELEGDMGDSLPGLQARLMSQALRKLAGVTQAGLSETLGQPQGNISRLENNSDMLLSTLNNYVNALGGKLRLTVELPDSPPIDLSGIGDFTDRTSP